MTTIDSTPRACPIAAGLEVLGERWSLLVLRELAFGVHRFDRIQAFTGAPRDVLTAEPAFTDGVVRVRAELLVLDDALVTITRGTL